MPGLILLWQSQPQTVFGLGQRLDLPGEALASSRNATPIVDIADNLTLRWKGNLRTWNPGEVWTLIGRREVGNSWQFRTHFSSPRLQFIWWLGGVPQEVTSDADNPWNMASDVWLEVSRFGTVVTFRYSNDPTDDPLTVQNFVTIGTPQATSAGSIDPDATLITLGSGGLFPTETMEGYVKAAAIYDNGVAVANPIFANASQTWTPGEAGIPLIGGPWNADSFGIEWRLFGVSYVTDAGLLVRGEFPLGTVTAGPVTISGVLFTANPGFPAGTVTSVSTISGVLFTANPSFPTGTVTAGPATISGVLFTANPTFPAGTVTAGPVTVSGVLLTVNPDFPQGTVTSVSTISGVLLEVNPVFPAGSVSSVATVSGVLLEVEPVFPQGTVTSITTLAGVLLTVEPVFPQGIVTSDQTVSGVLLVVSPVFPAGSVLAGAVTITGVLLVVLPSFPTGTVQAGAVTITGVLLVVSPVFPIGAVQAGQLVSGIVLVVNPVFPVGSLTQTAAVVVLFTAVVSVLFPEVAAAWSAQAQASSGWSRQPAAASWSSSDAQTSYSRPSATTKVLT